MKLSSQFAQGALVCVICSASLFLGSQLFTGTQSYHSYLFFIFGVAATSSIYLALSLGVFFGVVGLVRGPSWEPRLESLAAFLLNVIGLLFLLINKNWPIQ